MTVDELVMQIQQMGFSMGLRGSTMVPIIGKIREMEEGLLRLTSERDDAQVDQRLIEELWERRTEMTEMKEQIKLLRAERDEARRGWCIEICVDNDKEFYHAMNEASERGWDCFKEDKDVV